MSVLGMCGSESTFLSPFHPSEWIDRWYGMIDTWMPTTLAVIDSSASYAAATAGAC